MPRDLPYISSNLLYIETSLHRIHLLIRFSKMRPSWDSMRLLLLASTFLPAYAATTWGFTDATVAVQAKGAGIGNEFKEKYVLPKLYAAYLGHFH